MKTCKRCKKPAQEFPLTAYGKRSTMCPRCYVDTKARNAKKFAQAKALKENVAPGTDFCMACKRTKPLSDFAVDEIHTDYHKESTSRAVNCIECRQSGRKRAAGYRAKWTAEQKAKFDESKRIFHRNCRIKMIEAYGSQCRCCGETEPQFLAIDHVNNDGYLHRRKIGYDPSAMYRWAKKHGFPDSLQLLCHNCNVAKAYYGECPHKRRDQ